MKKTNQAPLPRDSRTAKNAGIFLLEGIGQTLSPHPFAEPFTMTQIFFISFFPFAFFLASGHVFWPLFKNGTYGKQGLTTSTWDGVEMGVCLRSKECWRKMAPDKNTMIQYITCQVWLGARSLTKNLKEESLVNREYLFPKGRKSLFTK